MSPKATQSAPRRTTKRLLLSSILLLSLSAGSSQAQDYTFLGNFGGHGYYLSTGTGTWIQSQLRALNDGLTLAHINSAAENTFVTTHVSALAWIGLGTALNFNTPPPNLSIYRWSDSVASSFTFFGSIGGVQQPDNFQGIQRTVVINSGGVVPPDAWDDASPSVVTYSVAQGPICAVDVSTSVASIVLGCDISQTATLTAQTAVGNPVFAWTGTGVAFLSSLNTASTVFTPTAAGTYTFTVTVTNSVTGCSASLTKTIAVTDVRERDEHGNLTGKVIICHVPPTTDQTKAIPPSALGGHLGHGDYCGPCIDNARKVKAQLQGIADNVLVYPNPIQSIFYVDVPQTEEVATVTLMDIQGKVLQSRKLNVNDDHKVQFNLEDSPLGMYFIEVNYGAERFRTKIARQ
jgi:hypothetical protein